MNRRIKTHPEPKRAILVSLALLCAISCLAALGSAYTSRLNRTLRGETETYLMEISSHISNTLTARLEADFKNLETVASVMDKQSGLESGAVRSYLDREAQRYGYMGILVSGTKGMGYTPDGQAIDLSSDSGYQKALRGQASLSNVIPSPIDGRDALIYSVPIMREDSIIGVLSAVSDLERTRKTLDEQSFHGQGFCHIVQRNGDVIMSSNNKNAVSNVSNCYSLWENSQLEQGVTVEQLREDFASGKQGTFVFRPDESRKYLSYQPLPINDWYLLSVVPAHVVTAQTSLFVRGTAVLCGALSFLFLLLFLVILTQQKHSKARLRALAFTDPVTGGGNANLFTLEAEHLIARAPAGYYAMVAWNLKGFKLINEAFGQKDGDRVLRHIYQAILEKLQDKETAARVFSDQFALLLHFTSQEAFILRLKGLVEHVNSFNQDRENKYFLSFTQGVYVIEDSTLDLVTIQDRANVARKGAKMHPGADAPVFYMDIARRQMIRQKNIENRMYTSLEREEFLVYLQPKYSLLDNTIQGAEALVRWEEPDLGLLPPSEFIPLFEENGFITRLDDYVFRNVCRILRRWQIKGIKSVPISINLSRVHLHDPLFLKQYFSICREFGVPPGLIEFEVTETLVVENVSLLNRMISEMHQLGFTCSMDDFGSGFSSLNLLKDVPVDTLKLDCAFFETEQDETSRGGIVIQSILDLAARLGMTTVAEGVETKSTLAFLRQAHCDLVQGFVYSQPLPLTEFERLMGGESTTLRP